MRRSWIATGVAGVLAFAPPVAAAQDASVERAAVLAVVDSALAAITRGDPAGFTDLMLPEANTFSIRPERYRVRTRAEERAGSFRGVVERGFRPEVRISGPLASVWLPYDLYLDGKWSHCGIDAFLLARTEGRWRIAAMAWSVEQPPACEPHPKGPPESPPR